MMEMLGTLWGAIVPHLDIISLSASSIAAIFSVMNWCRNRKKKKRDEAAISVVLECADYEEDHLIPVPLIRGALSRAELFGLIGSIPTVGGKRFKINELLKNKFWEEKFKPVFKGDKSTLYISCIKEEYEQFNICENRRENNRERK